MSRLYGLVLLLHAYVGWRVLPDLPFGTAGMVAASLGLAAMAGVMTLAIFTRRIQPHALSDAVAWAGFLVMGALSSLFVLTLLRDAGLLVGFVLKDLVIDAGSLHRFRGWSAAAVPAIAGVLTFVGFINARMRARVRSVDIPITGLPAALHGFIIAQISDIHVGPTIKRGYVDAIVDAVNALQADMIAVTGDLVDGSVAHLARHTQPLSRLSSRHGSFFVTGNHEYYSGANAWIAELRRLGMRVLMNEHVVLQHEGAAMVVAGVTDYGAQHFDPAQKSDPAAAMAGAPAGAGMKLLLAHQPRSAFAAEPAGFDLQLSGHTHGGQFLPWNFLVGLQQPFTAGLHRLRKLWVYTSRGTGYWGPPMRLGAPSEITRLTLVPA
jgi:predicted MPP superfamily phosphohydrolase